MPEYHQTNDKIDTKGISSAEQELSPEQIEEIFGGIHYEQSKSVKDSIVRLDQEADIYSDLEDHNTPVLVRGNWRIGKTSMIKSLQTHKYTERNSVFIDVGSATDSQLEVAGLDEFKQNFCKDDIARFLAKREYPGWPEQRPVLSEYSAKIREIKSEIEKSGKTPFEYLNAKLIKDDERAFLSLDEIMCLADQSEKMTYLSNLKSFSHLKLAIVLHRVHKLEDRLTNIFKEFKTYFVRPLNPDEVRALVQRPFKPETVRFEERAINEISEFTGGRPLEINILSETLLYTYSEYKNLKTLYTSQDIKNFTMLDLHEIGQNFAGTFYNYKRIYEHTLSEQEREIIDNLAANPISISKIDPLLVEPLIQTTLVKKDEDNSNYEINGNLFKRIVSEKYFNEMPS